MAVPTYLLPYRRRDKSGASVWRQLGIVNLSHLPWEASRSSFFPSTCPPQSRNLSDGWKYELAQVRKAVLAEKGREKYRETVGRPRASGKSLSTIDKDSHDTQAQIATELGWSKGKVGMADRVWKEAAPETKEKIKAGEVSFNQAYQEIRKKEKNAQRRKEFVEKKEAFEREPSRPATFARCQGRHRIRTPSRTLGDE